MATSKEATHQFEEEYARVFAAVCDAVRTEGMTIRAADLATGTIAVSSSMSAFSWGENATVRVWQESPRMTSVAVRSSLKFGLVDWGKNRRNVEKLFARTEEALRAGSMSSRMATDSPVPPGWHQDPTARHAWRYWDGSTWTPDVSDGGGVVGIDPL